MRMIRRAQQSPVLVGTVDTVLPGMVNDSGSDFDTESDSEDEQQTVEQVKAITTKIGKIPKRIENLAELRPQSWTTIVAAILHQ